MRKRLVTAPNIITAIRIAVVPLLAIFINRSAGSWAAGLMVLAGISDIVDGWLARKYKQESALGTLMDPVADKILLCVAVIYLVARPDHVFSPLMATLLLAREFFVSGLRAILASIGVVMGAGKLGKYKTLFQISGIVGIFLQIDFPIPFFQIGSAILLWTSVALSYSSMAKYSWVAYRELRASQLA